MRKRLVLALVLLPLAGGCSWFRANLKDEIAVSLKASTDQILPQYRIYVAADSAIPDSVRQVRLDNADELEKTIASLQPKE
jgi:hypothetical protein